MSTHHTHELLRTFLAPAGVSGCEGDIAAVVQATWAPLADEVSLSPLGSVHALLHGKADGRRPRLMVSAHMDSIGMIVTGFSGEFLRLAPAGTFDPRLLPGQSVRVLGRQPVGGTLLAPPQSEASTAPVPLTDLLVDCGLRGSALQEIVRIGDPVCLAQPPILLSDSRLASPRLDNRVSLAALTLCMEALVSERPHWDFAAAAVVREETDAAGSMTSGFMLSPEAAVAIDVTFGRTPDLPAHSTFALGAGLTNSWGPAVHPGLFRLVEQAAADCGVGLTPEFLPNLSSTDADDIQLTRSGVPTAVLSIPVLNLHSPVEVVDLGDIEQAARLLTMIAIHLGDRYRFEAGDD
jgi:endoglucanase